MHHHIHSPRAPYYVTCSLTKYLFVQLSFARLVHGPVLIEDANKHTALSFGYLDLIGSLPPTDRPISEHAFKEAQFVHHIQSLWRQKTRCR